MSSAEALTARVCALAQRASDLPSFRRGALEAIASLVPYDAALFHELSPRASLERAAVVGLDLGALARSQALWDENAVLLGRLRDLAAERGWVTTDAAAFPVRSAGRKTWDLRVARPLSVRATLVTHLVVGERIVSAVLLFRRTRARFAPDEESALREAQPALSVCDALHQLASSRELHGLRSRLRCVDQRLTPRQRDTVERVALGHTNEQIGQALGLSPNTVRNLLTDARARVGAANRADLVRLAVLR